MSAALISLCVIAILCLAAAEGPLNVVGEGLMSNPVPMNNAPFGKGVRYAGPIVYSNEKPPVIYFPPPPKNAKPGLGLFGKHKSPKSIKYVPMPHHDLPVLIYTSDKVPPIHVVQPPNGGSFNTQSQQVGAPIPAREVSSSFDSTAFQSSNYGLQEASSARVMTTSYEIPGTSYGIPVKGFEGSFGSPNYSTVSSSISQSTVSEPGISGSAYGSAQPPAPEYFSHGSKSVFGNGPSSPPRKFPPHIMYSGHPPIHVFNEPNMFVQPPKALPLKTYYEEMPPKASFGPPKYSFRQSSINSFGSQPYRPSFASFGPLGQAHRNTPFSLIPARENLVSSASSHNPTTFMSFGSPVPSLNSAKVESEAPVGSQSYSGGGNSVQSNGQMSYSLNLPQKSFSLGPFSIEYGPPTEPFVSYSEPTGSLSSLYSVVNGNGADDGWKPGPPPGVNSGAPIKDEVWNQPSPQSSSFSTSHYSHSPIQHGRGPNPIHSSVLFPSASFGSSKLANLFSSFKLKRSKPKYAIAPKSMHKPPIIIYYGKKPPVHVYQKPEEEQGTAEAGSSISSVSISPDSSQNSDFINNGNANSNENVQTASSSAAENIDLTYGASEKTDIRVAPSAPASSILSKPQPAIIPAKPVDIFPSTELQPSIYMARNSLNTIFVSDLSGSGASAIKTYIVRRSEDSDQMGSANSVPNLSIAQATVITPIAEQESEVGSIVESISNNDGSMAIAEDRISGSRDILSESPSSSLDSENQEENGNDGNSGSIISPTILLASVNAEPEQETQASEQEATVVVHQSPSSFQTNLSQAEKEAKEAVVSSS